MNGRIPVALELLGTPYCDGSQLCFVMRRTFHVVPPSLLPKYVTSNSWLLLQLRSFAMRSIRPLVGSMLISTLMRSPAPGATICGVLQCVTSLALAYVSSTCARPLTMSVYAT